MQARNFFGISGIIALVLSLSACSSSSSGPDISILGGGGGGSAPTTTASTGGSTGTGTGSSGAGGGTSTGTGGTGTGGGTGTANTVQNYQFKPNITTASLHTSQSVPALSNVAASLSGTGLFLEKELATGNVVGVSDVNGQAITIESDHNRSVALHTNGTTTGADSLSSINVYSPNEIIMRGQAALLGSTAADLSDANAGLIFVRPDRVPGAVAQGYETFGVFHSGTPVTNMPTTSTATYTIGSFVAIASSPVHSGNIGDTLETSGTENSYLAADFDKGTVNGRIPDLVTYNSRLGVDLVLNGVIQGTGYTGTATLESRAGGNAAGAVNYSVMNGGFYGANANSTSLGFILNQNINNVPTTIHGIAVGQAK